MLVSSSILKAAVEKYQQVRRLKEHYSNSKSKSKSKSNISGVTVFFSLLISIIFFTLELIVLFYAVNMALRCSQPGPERIVNLVLSVTFTMPYVMLNILFNQCAKDTLRGQTSWLPKGVPVVV